MEFIDKRPEGQHHIKPFEAMKITAEMLAEPVPSISDMVAERIRKRDDACYEELAEVILRYFPDAVCTGPILRDTLNRLMAADRRLQDGDCPSCGKYPTCHHNYGAHDVARINCPLWRPKG